MSETPKFPSYREGPIFLDENEELIADLEAYLHSADAEQVDTGAAPRHISDHYVPLAQKTKEDPPEDLKTKILKQIRDQS